VSNYKKYFHFFYYLLTLLIIFSASRLFFYWFNQSLFPDVDFWVFFYGLRFDISAILAYNFPFLILLVLFGFFKEKKWMYHFKNSIFVFFNFILVSYNCVDFGYYPFVLKRSTADGFGYLKSSSDFWVLMPQFIKDFWFVFVIGIIFNVIYLSLFFYLENKTKNQAATKWWKHFLISLFLIIVSIIGIRGGLQLKPIGIITANTHVEEKNAPLVLNTAFTIFKTLFSESLDELDFYTEGELKSIYNTDKNYFEESEPSKKQNVVLIIMESFSAEYIGALSGKKSHTPFLDSLIDKSIVFENAFANGKRSVEGLPSILSGIPHLMERAYITSPYATNKTESIAQLLKKEKYSTSFFHGGANGTMGFDAFCASAGIENYYGIDEYPNKKEHYDGNWGIFDEFYFQFFASKIQDFQNPFFSVFFSLSSHHPYTIPNNLKGKFAKGEIPILESVSYADYSLSKFFKSIENKDFFENTLFIITADHTGPPIENSYGNKVGMYKVPIIFYQKGIIPQRIQKTSQHIDILPSLMDYLNYPHSFFSFGNSVFSDSTEKMFAVNYASGVYQIKQENLVLQYDGDAAISLFDFEKDSLLTENLISVEKEKALEMENKLKAILQTYHNGLIKNNIHFKN
jgi:phosphoglycerol transferase MdoB-like AlkP superfamily enzyme